ncbi:MAG: hypothetical protein M3Y27_02130 [Acidobacteriota bacterium]|nr:hypothetical protein [Acidobacteriota bacterium]
MLFQLNLCAEAVRPETLTAWEEYLHELEQQRTERQQAGCYLWIACSPDLKQAVLAGQIVVKPVNAAMSGTDTTRVSGGELRHTFGGMFLKGETAARIRAVLDDYPHYPEIYGPEIVTARVLSEDKEGQGQKIFLRLRKHFVITVVLNMKCRNHWTTPDPTHSIEHTTASYIGEAKDPEHPDAGDRTPEEGRGFLWRYESYWRLQETREGVFVEHETISLSRRPPASLRFILRPILQRLPQEAMNKSMRATQASLIQKPKAAAL